MDYKSLTSLMLRMTGVVIMVWVISATPQTFVTFYFMKGATPDTAAWLLAIVAPGFSVLVGLLLIYFPATIANKIVSAGAESLDTLKLQQLAFSVLGLYFVSVAVFDMIYWLARLRIYFAVFNDLNYGQPFRLTPEDFAGIASSCAQLTAGVLLLFGGHGLANIIHKLRAPPASPSDRPGY
ncbi:hypothetical protein [Bradyrhizobium sp.]|uniref:hypothetical protein n=1 Tax=Bradyrhizobium sp. TaxID=376 RepID=UPI003C741FCA